MNSVMVDLETMSIHSDGAIVSIGAVEFDTKELTIGSEFYRVIDLQSSIDAGCSLNGSTILWWLQQGQEAREAITSPGSTLPSALIDFTSWYLHTGASALWGNGAAFDNVLLRSAFEKCQLQPPWKFWQDMCFRTMKTLYPITDWQFSGGTAHNALDDAKNQALMLIEILKRQSDK